MHEGILGVFTGHHNGAAVIRVGYSIASVREGMNVYTALYGANQGVTQDASVVPFHLSRESSARPGASISAIRRCPRALPTPSSPPVSDYALLHLQPQRLCIRT